MIRRADAIKKRPRAEWRDELKYSERWNTHGMNIGSLPGGGGAGSFAGLGESGREREREARALIWDPLERRAALCFARELSARFGELEASER